MKQRLPLLLALLLGVLATAVPAASAAIDTARIAQVLERTGVYVDPSFDEVVRPAQRRRIARLVAAATPRTYVVLVRLQKGDRFDGQDNRFLAALRGRLEGEAADAVFVLRGGLDRLDVADWSTGRPAYPSRATQAERVVAYEDVAGKDPDEPLGTQIERYFAVVGDANLERRAARAKGGDDDTADGRVPTLEDSGADAAGSGSSRVPTLFLVLVAVLVLAVVGLLLARRRGARPADDALPVLPDRVFEHARAAQRSGLRLDAETELLRLSELLDAQPVPDREEAQIAYGRALDGYAAARRTLTRTDRIVDVVGVLVLVDLARAELARAQDLEAGRRTRRRQPLCFFDPLHGRARRTVAWERGLEVPACAACAAAASGGGRPDVLRDGDGPYFEGDTVWARTGFGAFDDDLIGRVSRGD
ncbi:hypothetical protein ACVU7I_13450 [Patulibacter sp. S7RM1-6]